MVVMWVLRFAVEKQRETLLKGHLGPLIQEWLLGDGRKYEVLKVEVPIARGRTRHAILPIRKAYRVTLRDERGRDRRCWVLPGGGQVEIRWADEADSVASGSPARDVSPLWDRWLDG
jgi:hypothetical protein